MLRHESLAVYNIDGNGQFKRRDEETIQKAQLPRNIACDGQEVIRRITVQRSHIPHPNYKNIASIGDATRRKHTDSLDAPWTRCSQFELDVSEIVLVSSQFEQHHDTCNPEISSQSEWSPRRNSAGSWDVRQPSADTCCSWLHGLSHASARWQPRDYKPATLSVLPWDPVCVAVFACASISSLHWHSSPPNNPAIYGTVHGN
jgi:hypothetical protein